MNQDEMKEKITGIMRTEYRNYYNTDYLMPINDFINIMKSIKPSERIKYFSVALEEEFFKWLPMKIQKSTALGQAIKLLPSADRVQAFNDAYKQKCIDGIGTLSTTNSEVQCFVFSTMMQDIDQANMTSSLKAVVESGFLYSPDLDAEDRALSLNFVSQSIDSEGDNLALLSQDGEILTLISALGGINDERGISFEFNLRTRKITTMSLDFNCLDPKGPDKHRYLDTESIRERGTINQVELGYHEHVRIRAAFEAAVEVLNGQKSGIVSEDMIVALNQELDVLTEGKIGMKKLDQYRREFVSKTTPIYSSRGLVAV